VGVWREIAWAQDEKTEGKKNCTRLIFVGFLILVMIEDAKGWVNQKKKKKELAYDRILALAYSFDTMQEHKALIHVRTHNLANIRE
jgi:hypothetical protein